MNVSREYAIMELNTVLEALGRWRSELEAPVVLGEDDREVPAYGEDGPPPRLSVGEVHGIDVDQFRGELLAIAGKLEAMAAA